MKKSRFVGLLLLYIAIFISVIVLQTYAIRNSEMRTYVNLVTLAIAAVGGFLFWLLLQEPDVNGPKEKDAKGKEEDTKDIINVVTKKKYVTREEYVSKEEYVTAMESYHLTKRELELGFLIVSGYSNQRIAQELFISETTVKKHVTHIYEKTGVQSRKEFRKKLLYFSGENL